MLDSLGCDPSPGDPLPFPRALTSPPRLTLATQVLEGLALLGVLQFHLLGSLLAGLLVYELVHLLAPSHTSSFVHRRNGAGPGAEGECFSWFSTAFSRCANREAEAIAG